MSPRQPVQRQIGMMSHGVAPWAECNHFEAALYERLGQTGRYGPVEHRDQQRNGLVDIRIWMQMPVDRTCQTFERRRIAHQLEMIAGDIFDDQAVAPRSPEVDGSTTERRRIGGTQQYERPRIDRRRFIGAQRVYGRANQRRRVWLIIPRLRPPRSGPDPPRQPLGAKYEFSCGRTRRLPT